MRRASELFSSLVMRSPDRPGGQPSGRGAASSGPGSGRGSAGHSDQDTLMKSSLDMAANRAKRAVRKPTRVKSRIGQQALEENEGCLGSG